MKIELRLGLVLQLLRHILLTCPITLTVSLEWCVLSVVLNCLGLEAQEWQDPDSKGKTKTKTETVTLKTKTKTVKILVKKNIFCQVSVFTLFKQGLVTHPIFIMRDIMVGVFHTDGWANDNKCVIFLSLMWCKLVFSSALLLNMFTKATVVECLLTVLLLLCIYVVEIAYLE